MKKGITRKQLDLLDRIAGNIKKIRNQKNMSQEELAFNAKVDRSYMSDIERGERNLSIITLQKIADALEVKMETILA